MTYKMPYDEYEMTCEQVGKELGLSTSNVYEIDRLARKKIVKILEQRNINIKELLDGL